MALRSVRRVPITTICSLSAAPAPLAGGADCARAGIPEALAKDTATEAVNRFHQVWANERARLPISKNLETEINRLLTVIPLAMGR